MRSADDFDAIRARMAELRGCPTARTLKIDVQYYCGADGYYYRGASERGTKRFEGFSFGSNGFAFFGPSADPPTLEKIFGDMAELVFEEIPAP